MIIEIDGKRRRFERIEVRKVKGKDEYFMFIRSEAKGIYGGDVIAPFWANVETKDLEEDWEARFSSQLIKASTPDSGWFSGYPCDKETYAVSWNKTPKVWQDLFLDGLKTFGYLED